MALAYGFTFAIGGSEAVIVLGCMHYVECTRDALWSLADYHVWSFGRPDV